MTNITAINRGDANMPSKRRYPLRRSTSTMEIARAIQSVALEVAKAHRLRVEDLVISRRRYASIVAARQEAMWKARTVPGASYPIIGWYFQRHHTTVIHGVRNYARRFISLV